MPSVPPFASGSKFATVQTTNFFYNTAEDFWSKRAHAMPHLVIEGIEAYLGQHNMADGSRHHELV